MDASNRVYVTAEETYGFLRQTKGLEAPNVLQNFVGLFHCHRLPVRTEGWEGDDSSLREKKAQRHFEDATHVIVKRHFNFSPATFDTIVGPHCPFVIRSRHSMGNGQGLAIISTVGDWM